MTFSLTWALRFPTLLRGHGEHQRLKKGRVGEEQDDVSASIPLSLCRSALTDAVSRALDNIGHVYARMGKFQQAINT